MSATVMMSELTWSEYSRRLKEEDAVVFLPVGAVEQHGYHMAMGTDWMLGTYMARRAAELGISPALQGVHDKITTVEDLAREAGLSLEAVGYMGDDIIDLPVLRRVGFAASVPNAPFYIGQAAHWISTLRGGAGAVRECCDLILAAQGRLGACFTASLSTLGGAIQ